jgi:hypothetical protein
MEIQRREARARVSPKGQYRAGKHDVDGWGEGLITGSGEVDLAVVVEWGSDGRVFVRV